MPSKASDEPYGETMMVPGYVGGDWILWPFKRKWWQLWKPKREIVILEITAICDKNTYEITK